MVKRTERNMTMSGVIVIAMYKPNENKETNLDQLSNIHIWITYVSD